MTAASASFDSIPSSFSLTGADSPRPASRHRTRIPAPVDNDQDTVREGDRSFADAAAAEPRPVVNGAGKVDMRREIRNEEGIIEKPDVNDPDSHPDHHQQHEQSSGRQKKSDISTDKSVEKKKPSGSSSFFGNGSAPQRQSVLELTVEKFQDKDGEHLTTVKSVSAPDEPRPHLERSDTLVSGRRPGGQ